MQSKIRIRKEDGFSLVELLVVMALFVVVLALTSKTFTLILKQSTQQTKQTETQMERIVGLEILRTDIGSAGLGLPWSFRNTISYNEAVTPAPLVCGGNGSSGLDPSQYNDTPSGVPRAIIGVGGTPGPCINGSDYLIIKGTAVGANSSSQNWSYISYGSTVPRTWGVCNDSIDIPGNDNVIVIEPQHSSTNIKQLVMNGSGSCSTTNVCSTAYSCTAFSPNFAPFNPGEAYLIYDIGPADTWGMPFNRADYYISTNTPTYPNLVPSSCAPNTGVLVKATVSHKDGTMTNLLPLLDCVADMQVVYALDTNGGGVINSYSDDISGFTADQIRNQVVEVRLYILSHEGKMDTSYTYPNATVTVGEFGLGSVDNIGTGWKNYRWKVSTIVVKTENLL